MVFLEAKRRCDWKVTECVVVVVQGIVGIILLIHPELVVNEPNLGTLLSRYCAGV